MVHAVVAGRLRLGVAGLKRRPERAAALARSLAAHPGILAASANPLTGCVLLRHQAGLGREAVVALVAETAEALWRGCAAPPPRAPADAAAAPHAPPWHHMDVGEVLQRLGSSPRGLDEAMARRRLEALGANVLPPLRGRSPLDTLSGQLLSLPVGLLGLSAAVSLATGGAADALVIAAVVATNTFIGYLTERRSERVIAGLSSYAPRRTRVRRGGAERTLTADALVPGDLIPLRPGTQVPADLRLLDTRRLSIDESALSGESLPVLKRAEAAVGVDAPLVERADMAYLGTLVTGGSGLGVVVGTGEDTELGRIQALAGDTRPPETPMQRQLDALGTQLALASGAVCAGVFALGLLRGHGRLPMLKAAVSLAVAAVPEGLPAVATTALALGIRSMRGRRVAVRRLEAIETLGAVQVFCLDKTGTLTCNHMSVVSLSLSDASLAVVEGRLSEAGRPVEAGGRCDLRRLLELVSLCSETELNGDGPRPTLAGSPTENALVELAVNHGLDVRALRAAHPRIGLHYRAEGRPYICTLHRRPGGGRLLAVKGSPAEVLALCVSRLRGDEVVPLDEAQRRRLLRENERMAAQALRVLAVAYREPPGRAPAGIEHLTWVGLVGMIDPLRPGMAELMAVYHRAGVETVMITGDQGATAEAIGRQLGLSNGRPLKILEAANLEGMDPRLLEGLVRRTHVFARVSPAHKLRIVQALQRGGRVVAMTGDGINDGPALRAADVGVAMGGTGTDVARSLGDVVLEDDNLATMAVAIAEGRRIYANICKAVHFLLATNLSEIEVMLAGLACGLGPPLNPMQLLWINLISDIFPGLALSMEPAEPDVLARPPRDPGEPIIRRDRLARMGRESAVLAAGALAAFGYGRLRHGPGARAGSLAFTTLTLGQLLHALVCRSERRTLLQAAAQPRNPYLLGALGLSLLVQLLVTLLPPGRRLLGIVPPGPADLAVACAGALLPLVVNEAGKPRAAGAVEAVAPGPGRRSP